MPDQDRGVKFLHTLNQDQEAGVRCPSCPGYKATYQADCVCCGREVACGPDSKPNDPVITCLNVKPELVEAAMPKSATSQAAPAAENQACKRPRTRQSLSPISVLKDVNSFQRPSVGSGNIGSRVVLPAGSRNSVRILQRSARNAVRPSSSSRRNSTCTATRGRPTVTRIGAHQDFKGVRTRSGVRGFLVEIRPPKWKKTIWLGTYNTDVEAAGAFDAGVFYTNKPNTKYNFRALETAFPPLPSHLSLERPDNMEEIKYFVQKQAKLAAAAAHRMCYNNHTDCANMSGHVTHQELLQEVKPTKLLVAKVTNDLHSSSNSESCLTVGSVSGNAETDLPTTPDADEYGGTGFLDVIPMDLVYLRGSGLPAVDEEAAENWIAEYTNYWNTQPAELKKDNQ